MAAAAAEMHKKEVRAAELVEGSGDGSTAALKSQLVILGSGSSTGCPKPRCSINTRRLRGSCDVSWEALMGDPVNNPNYRNNPSMLIRVAPPPPPPKKEEGWWKRATDPRRGKREEWRPPRHSNYIIDVGKTFRETITRWGPRQDPPLGEIDGIILTHEHADAMLGLDDVRGLQDPYSKSQIPIYLSKRTLQRVKGAFPYLMDTPLVAGQEKRFVAR